MSLFTVHINRNFPPENWYHVTEASVAQFYYVAFVRKQIIFSFLNSLVNTIRRGTKI